jgi:hypothetical protein
VPCACRVCTCHRLQDQRLKASSFLSLCGGAAPIYPLRSLLEDGCTLRRPTVSMPLLLLPPLPQSKARRQATVARLVAHTHPSAPVHMHTWSKPRPALRAERPPPAHWLVPAPGACSSLAVRASHLKPRAPHDSVAGPGACRCTARRAPAAHARHPAARRARWLAARRPAAEPVPVCTRGAPPFAPALRFFAASTTRNESGAPPRRRRRGRAAAVTRQGGSQARECQLPAHLTS